MNNENVISMNSNYHFRGKNLKNARVLRGYSITEVSEKLKISKQSISYYENDNRIPTMENLNKLAEYLKFPINYFYSNLFDEEPNRKVGFFRKYSKVPKKDMERVEILSKLTYILYKKLGSKINFPTYQPIVEVEKTKCFEKISRDYIEEVANEIRKKYKLGYGPLINLTGFIESLGIIVSFIDLDDLKIDAYTNIYDGIPVILINSQRLSSSRIRFNIAHEFAHILFHSEYIKDYSTGDVRAVIEEEANFFCWMFPSFRSWIDK